MNGHDDRRHANGSRVGAHSSADQHEAAAGRSTLTEQLYAHEADGAPLPVWESIDHNAEPPLPSPRAFAAASPTLGAPATTASEQDPSQQAAAPAHTAAPPQVDSQHPAVADDPNASERIYGDQHHNAHASPYETHHKHAERLHPKFDKFNRHTIDDRATKHAAGRPGVVVNGQGLFMINKPHATRYTFVRHGHTNVAQPFDVVDRATLTTTNWKSTGHEDPAKHDRLLANPSTPRLLHIEGKDHLCVLTWYGSDSSAWIKVEDLEHGHAIAHVARERGHKEDPSTTSHDPDVLMHHTTHYVIRNDSVGQVTPGDAPHKHEKVLAAGAKGGDNLSHYLEKDHHKEAFDAAGKATGQTVTRSYVAVVMNLPEEKSPPIASDTVLAGESFFVMNDHSFHRRTPVFRNGKRHTNLLETWVFGHIGMRDAHGHLRPDPTRRGWVPLRVLAEAKHLEVHDVPQR